MEELKPCPFCDGEAELDFAHTSFTYTDVFGKTRETGFFYTVKCRDNSCGCKIGVYEEPRMAIEAWNRKAKGERMKIRYQCSNCGQRFQTSAMAGVPDGMYLCGCRVVGDAFYCEECVKTWAERNGAEFDKQFKDPVGMFTKWWNRMVDDQAKSEGKTVKRYHVLPNGD